MSTNKRQIWVSEYDWIGAIGVDTVEEFAALVMTSEEAREELTGHPDASLARVMTGLTVAYHVHAIKVPVPVFRLEYWDGSNIHSMDIDARPGRGYVKVLGVHL